MDKHGQGTHCIKIGADSLAENSPNYPEFICPTCLPKPKSSGFQWKKASLGVRSPWLPPYVNVLRLDALSILEKNFIAKLVAICMAHSECDAPAQ